MGIQNSGEHNIDWNQSIWNYTWINYVLLKRKLSMSQPNKTTQTENWRKQKLQIPRNLRSGHHQTTKNKKQNKKGYLWRTRKLIETKFCYSIKGINTWTVLLVRYSRGFFKFYYRLDLFTPDRFCYDWGVEGWPESGLNFLRFRTS